jgi:hypothetical protein
MRILSVLIVGVLLVPVAAAPAASAAPATAPAASAAPATAPPAAPCRPGIPAVAPPTTEFLDPARPELGPAARPAPPVGPLTFFYRRFGTLTADAFAAKYRSGGSWVYPPADGFLVLAGHPVRYREKLAAGRRVDRFGYPGGGYLAPARTPFARRALPPQNLTTPVGTPVSNYHLYCVLVPFDVAGGPIAPWFEQPGLGWQYKLDGSYLPAAGGALSVTWLIQHGYLVEERPA